MVSPAEQSDSTKSADDVSKVRSELERSFIEELKAVDEPSLIERSKDKSAESYRFIWLFSSRYPLCVRLDLLPDGTGILTTRFYRQLPAKDGDSRQNSEVRVSKEEVASFVASVHKLGLWSLPPAQPVPKGVYILDAVRCVFEEASHGKYYVLERLSPRDGPMLELGNEMYRWARQSQ